MPDLSVEVRDRQIVVSNPSQGLSVTYLKDAYSPLLVALDPMRDDPPTARRQNSSPARGARPTARPKSSAGS